ncbi:hypothetical protein HZB93_02980 [Candidatus Falkowbacteria bacterium]|nr:hypothetical protein [Candidatus Falkowbacteria bacterium]
MDLQEVQKYRPIPKGGLKLLVFPLLFLLSATVLWVIVHYDLDKEKWVMRGGIILGLVTILMLAEIIGVRHPIRWLRDYWWRNVKGYNAWYWRDEEQKIQVSFTRRGEKEDEYAVFLKCPVIKVPLGGWFNSWGCVYRHRFNEVGQAQGWKVRLPSDPWRNALSPHVTLVDAENHSITPDIGTALDFCEYYFIDDRVYEWILRASVMLVDIKRLMAERDEAKKRAEELEGKWKTACRQREDALSVIAEAIGRIDATKRFIKSDQAQAIRKWLSGRLAAMAPVGAPGTMFGARETLTQPAACEIVGRVCGAGG